MLERYETPDGHLLNKRTLNMWNEAEHILGVKIPITQGSYNPGGVAASSGAHDGGGAVDAPPKYKTFTHQQLVRVLRRVGFAAWHRQYTRNLWPEHIHAIALGDKELSYVAANQAKAYFAGYDGLGHLGMGGLDTGPRDIIHTWEDYKENHPNRFPPKA